MPPSRLHGRYSIGRRPSGFASPTSDLIKPGIYGASPSPRSVTFAPNVTPGTYQESDDLVPDVDGEFPLPPDAQLFPPSEQPPNPAPRRRAPPGKRRSLGYIPRPPNAFMLFRADFVRQKHVPGSIETTHGTLSKIIGNCWRQLPLEQKRIWENMAKQEKEAHTKKYPGYRFRPVHNKDKPKKKEKPASTAENERRCEEVAQLLLGGVKGDQLAAAIRELDGKNVVAPVPQSLPPPFCPLRRPSSVPLHDSRIHPIALPSLPFFNPMSRSASPVHNISRSARMIIGQRRPSSALPHFGRTSWGVDDMPFVPSLPAPQSALQRDESSLPEFNASLFEDTFHFGFPAGCGEPVATTFHDIFPNLPPHAACGSPPSYDLAPIDHVPLQDLALSMEFMAAAPATSQMDFAHANVLAGGSAWTNVPPPSISGSSSTYSGSPAQSELGLPAVIAPHPQHATDASGLPFGMWHDSHVTGVSPVACYVPGESKGPSGFAMDPIQSQLHDYDISHDVAVAGIDMDLFNSTFMGMNGL